MTNPAEPAGSAGKRRRTPATRPVTGRPSTVRAMRPSGPADAAVAGSVSTGTGEVSAGCAGRTTPGAAEGVKVTVATAPPAAGPAIAAAPAPRQAPSETDRDGPRAGCTTSGPSATRA